MIKTLFIILCFIIYSCNNCDVKQIDCLIGYQNKAYSVFQYKVCDGLKYYKIDDNWIVVDSLYIGTNCNKN